MIHSDELKVPGDILDTSKTDSSKKVILGPGLINQDDKIFITKAGILRHKSPNCYWIENNQKRYVPSKGENVIGIAVQKAGDVFRIDVGSSEPATLSYLSFEGATKRNRPDVKIGDIVFARFLVANKDMEPELVCIDSAGRSNGLGLIRDDGFVITVPLQVVRKILSPECQLLKKLGDKVPYEIAVGMNGRIWIKGRSTQETLALANTIDLVEFMDNNEIKSVIDRFFH